MLGEHLTPGQHAHVDQVLALVDAIDKAWPYNQSLLNDSECERVVLERLGEPWQAMRDDRAYLLWANGRLAQVRPDPLVIGEVARKSAPRLTASECDRCRRIGTGGVAVVACPRNLVALLLCTNCIETVEPDLLLREGIR